MITTITNPGVSSEILADLQNAVDASMKGVRNPQKARKAREEMDQIREEIRNEHGVLDIGIPAIRELRDDGLLQIRELSF
jgi:succinate dehydrogenase/fumarate reductase flavoprotein subunit